MELLGFHRVALGGYDVAKSPQTVASLRAEAQRFSELKTFSRDAFGRFAIDVYEGGCFDSEQFRFYGAMSACPCNSKRGLGNVEGSLGIPGRERLAGLCQTKFSGCPGCVSLGA